MTINRTTQGAYSISTMHNGYLVSRAYYFMTKREAVTAFRAELRELT